MDFLIDNWGTTNKQYDLERAKVSSWVSSFILSLESATLPTRGGTFARLLLLLCLCLLLSLKAFLESKGVAQKERVKRQKDETIQNERKRKEEEKDPNPKQIINPKHKN